MAKLDITSTVVEKGLEAATNFVNQLIGPAAQEAGLLIKDHITQWRLKNQIRMLAKTEAIVQKGNIKIKQVSLKLVYPLLELSALEEDEVMQDRWATLLSNLVDSDQNIENHVFPYVLSQMSKTEFLHLENVYKTQFQRITNASNELATHITNYPTLKKELDQKIAELEKQYEASLRIVGKPYNEETIKIRDELSELRGESMHLSSQERSLKRIISEPEVVSEKELKEFEISNLCRLAVIKEVFETYAPLQKLEIPQQHPPRGFEYPSPIKVNLEIEIESDRKYLLTEFGILFMKACS